jgi:RND family efflux transporter MFP subunit
MIVSKPIAVLSAGCLMLLSVAALAQSGGGAAPPGNAAVQALVLDEPARIDWIEKSDVAALREGVIETMELQIGMPVEKGGTIGALHKRIAWLTVAKSKLQADQTAPAEKAEAQKEVAIAVVAINQRLEKRKPGMVSKEEIAKAEGELKVAEAMLHEALENQGIANAELNLAAQTLKEHAILAPFDGIIIKRMKNPGESVRASEAVVQLGNLSKLCANAYVPLAYAYRVKEGQVVEIQPRIITGPRGGEPLAIEKKRFRGKIVFVDPQIQPVAETAVRIRAEFQNANFELRPGLEVQMTVFLTADAAAAATEGVGTTRTAANPVK